MFSFNPLRWANSLFRSRVKTIVKKPRYRLVMEELESRLAPATYTWTGGGGAANPGWATAANWGGVAINQSLPIDLVFSTPTAYATNNNLTGLSINSITFNNSNFTLNGNQITLGNPLTSGSGFIIVQGGLSGENIGLNMQLAGAGTSTQFFTVHTGATLTVSGQISGTTGSQLTVQGGGTVILSGNNSGYIGPLTINNDQSTVEAENSNALGGIRTSTVETLVLNNPALLPSATTFRLTFGTGAGSQTGNLTYTGTPADAGAVQTALNALTTIQNGGGGSVQVSQTNTATSETFRITFTGTYTGTSVVSQITGAVNAPPNGASFAAPTTVAGGVASPYVVTVGNNSQLQLVSGAGSITIPNTVNLFGTGIANTGALVNVSGTNTWSGSVVLENIAANPNYINVRTPVAPNPSQLTISGVISDTGSGGSLTKLGGGTLILTNANAYHGSTFIENGILNIQNPLALGAVRTAGTFTQHNSITGDQGTLQLQYVNAAFPVVPGNSQYFILQDPTQAYSDANPYVGFVVPGYSLFLLGPGFGATATLGNIAGDNAWSGPVTLQTAQGLTSVNIDTENAGAVQSQLAITGVISDQDPANPAILNKSIGQGNLVLEPTIHTASVDLGSSYNVATLPGGLVSLVESGGSGTANTYLGQTNINVGTVTLVDSQGLGANTKTAITNAGNGSSLDLVSNVGHIDSVTNTSNRLLVDSPLSLNGFGYQINGQDAGTLHSISGINTYGPNATYNAANPGFPFIINFAATSSIGVEPDPTQTNNNNYFTNDYSLTISGGIGNNAINFDPVATYVVKVDAGQLILPNANSFFYGAWDIHQGWVTVQNPLSLGGQISGAFPNVSPTAYFNTTVDSGAALMLRPFYPNTGFTLNTNLILEGNGITHAFPLIDQMGAVENLEGVNTLSGNVTLIGQAGIGVEQVDPTILSNLTMTGHMSQAQTPAQFNSVAPPATISVPNTFAVGGVSQYKQVVDTGSTQGSLVINYTNFVGDNLRVYYGAIGTPGSSLVFNSTLTGTGATPAITFGPGAGTQIEIVIDQGVIPAGAPAWAYNGTVTVNSANFTGGLIKVGSQELILEGAGNYQGGVDVRTGVLLVENNTALGTPLNTGAAGRSFGTTVEAGAALVLSPSVASLNGGQSTGLSIAGNHLTLSGTGNSLFGDAPLTVTAADNLWTGPITLSTDYAITYQNKLGNQALPVNPVAANFTTPTGATTLTGTSPTVTAKTTTAGAAGLNDVETLNFGGSVSGGVFTLTVWDGAAYFTTGNITWAADPNALIQAIQAALNLDPLLAGNFMVALISPIIDVAPNARLNVTGNINDGTTVASPLIHNYTLSGPTGSYADTLGGPSLVPTALGTLSSTGYSWPGYPTANGNNQGLTLSNWLAGNATPGNYTIQLDFDFSQIPILNGTDYARILDFTNRTSDNGLYAYAPDPTTSELDFWNGAPFNGPDGAFVANTPEDLIFERDGATGTVNAYINGAFQFTFNDAAGDAVASGPNNVINFFIDDLSVFLDEIAGGNVTGIKVYDRSLTAAEVGIVSAGGVLTPSSSLPSDLIVAGGGSLQLDGANTYRGTTYVNQGTLTVTNGQALGATPGTGQQSIALTNAIPGVTKFQLAFGSGAGSQTAPITYTGTAADAASIQTALQGLTTIGANNAVVIQENPGVFLVTFPNPTLASSTQLISPTIVSGTGVSGTAIVAGLLGGTEVANNSQLQLQGGITVAGEPLTIQGVGSNLEPSVQTYTVGTTNAGSFTGAYTLNFNNAPALTLTGNTTLNSVTVTGLSSTAQLAVGMQVSGGGVPPGATILAIVNNTTITLSANATATASPALTFTVQLAYNTSAAQIQASLQNLSAVGSQGGQISVSVQSVNTGTDDTQTFFVPGTATSATNFGFKFGPTVYDSTPRLTGNIFSSGNSYSPNNYFADAQTIGKALNSLANIGGVGGLASVTGDFANVGGVAGILYTVTFSGALAGQANLPTLILPPSGSGAPSGPGAVGIVMETHVPGSPPTVTYQATFLGTFSGVNQPLLTVPTVSGTTTVSTPNTQIVGGSANSTPDQWFSTAQGNGTLSTSITNTQSYFGLANAENAAGPVTGIAVDPTDANTIYITTAGGGAWRTRDGGQTWLPLFDSQFAGANPAVLFGGAIAIDPSHVNIIYYATGNANGSGALPGDSYYGAGVYESQDYGQTWTLLIDTSNPAYTVNGASPGNPLYGTAISKIIILDGTGSTPQQIVVNASDVNTTVGLDIHGLVGDAGVWYYNQGKWTNTTAGVLPAGVQAAVPGGVLPSTNAVYSDLFYDGTTMYMALSDNASLEGVYTVAFPANASGAFAWNVTPPAIIPVTLVANSPTATDLATYQYWPGQHIADTLGTAIPVGTIVGSVNGWSSPGGTGILTGFAGTITMNTPLGTPQNSAIDSSATDPMGDSLIFYGFGGPANDTIKISGDAPSDRVFATVTGSGLDAIIYIEPVDDSIPDGAPDLDVTTSWNVQADTNAAALNNIPNYLAGSASYANAIYVNPNVPDSNLYVGGSDAGSGTNFLLSSGNDGVTWTDLVNGNSAGPQTDVQALISDSSGNLLSGSDGGIWRLVGTSWTDITGNLGAAQFNSIATDPNNPNVILAGGHSVGISLSTLGAVAQATVDLGGVTSVAVLNGDSGYFTNSPPSVSFVGGGGFGATATATVNAAGVLTGIIVNTPGSGYASVPQVVIAPSGIRTWTQVAGGGNTSASGFGQESDGGQVAFDPASPGVAYYSESGQLETSTDGGVTWINTPAAASALFPPFANNPSNLITGPAVSQWTHFLTLTGDLTTGSTTVTGLLTTAGLQPGMQVFGNGIPAGDAIFTIVNNTTITIAVPPATITGPSSLLFSSAPISLGAPVQATSLGVSDFQGAYQSDPAFPNLTAFAANHNDTSTIYVTDGTAVDVTKNLGLNWATGRGPTLATGTTITKIIVDPADRDTAFVVTSGKVGAAGVGHVFETTNAGQTWSDISAGLPDLSVWSVAVDPRTNDVYVGNDIGIYKLAGGVGVWQKFGVGLPNVMVTDIDINTNANVLTIATYGRGAWQFYLDDTQANAGALRALAGNDIWTGDITLVGPATIGANGSQNLQNGFSGAQLTVLGTIGDSTPNAVGNTLTKIGGGDVVLSGSNTYAGVTLVQQGNVVVNNPDALGAATVAGSQLLTFSGMVPGISEFNLTFGGSTTATPLLYTGVAATDAANIQTALDALSSIGASNAVVSAANAGGFLITFPNAPLATSTQVVSAAIVAGLDGSAIGSASTAVAGATVVAAGAAVELQSNLDLEPITLNGNGIQPPYNGHYTGALINVSNFNTYTGTITLNSNSTIGVTAGQLTISSANANGIVDGGNGYSLNKEGAGTLVLTSPDTYSGGTSVTTGVIQIQNSQALGPVTSSTIVTNGAQLQLQATAGPVLASAALASGGNLALNVPYYYVVTAVNATGDESVLSNQLSATPLVSGTQAVSLAWSAVPGAVSYRVYRSTTSGNFTNAFLTTVTTPGFTDLGANTLPGTPLGLNVGQHLYLDGTGILNDGALRNVAGNNTWSGAITLSSAPNFSPASSTAGVVAVFVDPTNTLTLSGHIGEGTPPGQSNAPASTGSASTGLTEIGAGTLVLANSNTYTGGTYVGYIFGSANTNGASAPATVSSGGVNGGVIDIQNSNALGANQGNEVQRITTYDPPGASDTFALTFNGQTTANLPFGALAQRPTGPSLTAVTTQAGGSLTAGTTYYYVVTATVGGVESAVSNQLNTGVIAANKTAHLTWTAITGATYNVYRTTTNGVYATPALMNATPLAVGTTSFTDNGATAPVAGTVPTDVQDALNALSSINAGGGSVTVTGTSEYTGLNEVQTLALANPTSSLNVPTGFTATLPPVAAGGNLAPSTQYYYEVTAVTPLGESIPTAAASATTTTAVGNNLTINLAWTAVPGATSYKIYRSTVAGNFTQAYLTSVTTPSYADAGSSPAITAPAFNGLTSTSITTGGTIPAGTYNYVITATGPTGESALSTAISVTIPTALSGTAEVKLSWAVVPGATGYRIYRSTTTNYTNSLIAVIPSGATTAFTDTNAVSTSLTPPVQTKFTLRFGSNTILPATTNGTTTVTLASTAQLSAGMLVTGTGISAGTTILTIVDATHITLSSTAATGTPTLTFIPTTPAISYTGIGGSGAGSDAAAIQTALSGLPAIGAGNILVTPDATDTVFTITFIGAKSDTPQSTMVAAVTQSTASAAVTETSPGDGGINYIYTVTFNGYPLAGAAQPLILATTSSAAMTAGVSEVATGGFGVLVYNGAALQVDGDPTESGAPGVVLSGNEIIALNGTGPNNTGALLNVSGANTVQGNIILQSDSALGANATTQMTLTGLVQDAPPPTSNPIPTTAPTSVTKIGTGSIVLAPATQTITLANPVSALNIPVLNAPVYIGGGTISSNFFYDVTVIGPNGESMPSAPMNTPIAALTNRITNLTWTNPLGSAATGYRIYRATAVGGPYTLLANIDSGATLTYADIGSTALLVGTPPVQTNFTLSIGGHTSSQISYTGLASLAAAIQTHLQNDILNGNYPGVTASVQALSPSTFTVTYSGTAAALGAVPALTSSIVTGTPGRATISTNTFSGDVYVNAGVLNIQSAQALGVSTSAVQEISVFGSSGSFTLRFNGSTTGPLQYGIPASGGASATASIQNALNSLPSISAINPNGVTVTQIGNSYFVYFNGAGLADRYQNPITDTILTPGIISLTITPPLAGGATNVDVASGASLQTQSNYPAQAFSEASGKYLTIAGSGTNNTGALQNVSGANAWGATPITLGTNAVAIGNADTNATFFLNQAITDSFLTPTIQFSGFVNGDTFTLSYGGAVTASLVYTGNNAIDLATIQTALAGLSSVIPLGGTVSVTSPGANKFNVTFTNTLYGTFAPGIGSLPVTTAAGVFVTPVPPATSDGYGVNKVGLGTVQYDVGNSYTGTTNVIAGKLQFDNTTGTGFTINGPLVVGNTTPIHQVQTLTLGSVANPFAQLDQFTLTYGASTTGNITYYQNASYEAAAIQNALNAVLGANFVSVTATSATVFTVTLNGLSGPYPLPGTPFTGANLTNALAPVSSTVNVSPIPAAFAPESAIAQLEASTTATAGQINPLVPVTVNSDGLYDLNGFTQTDAALTINVGTAQTGTGALTVTGALNINDGNLDVQSSGGSVTANGLVTMTGGVINLAAGGTLNLNANLTAISDATGPALITGLGTVQEGSATQTFTVTHGPAAAAITTSDLIDSAVITGSASAGIVKTGPGRMEITVQDTYPGSTTINQGDVQVDPVVNTTQIITLVGAIGGTTQITLSFNGATAAASTFTYSGTTATDVASIQAALIALGIPAGNIFSVTGNAALDTIFTIVFNTALAPIMPAITSDPTANAPTGTNAFVTTSASTVNNVGTVVLNGASGSLSGAGFVGGIANAGPGVINPGINITNPKAGILTVNGNVTFAPSDTLFVDLAIPSGHHPDPIAGTDYDQLSINGSVNLNGALLAGTVTQDVVATPVGDNFTVLQASGGVTGAFTGDIGNTIGTVTDHLFIGGEKFLVTYNTNSVVLTHVLDALSSFTMTSAQNPSVYGQNTTFTITAVAEPGATLTAGTPTFTITETPVTPIAGPPVVIVVPVPASGIYIYTPPPSLYLNSGTSTFTVSVAFSDPNVFLDYPPASPTPPDITQTVNQNTVDVTLTGPTPTTPVYGQQIVFTGTATPHTPLTVTGAQPPTGNIEFTVDPTGVDQVTDAPISGGAATLTIAPGTPPLLGAGTHSVAYQYVGFSPANIGDPNYAAGPILNQTFTVAQDSSHILFTPPSPSSYLQQNANINVVVAPNLVGSTGVPTGTVDFYDGVPDLVNFTNRLNSTPLSLVNGAATLANNTLLMGSHTIYVVYSGDANYIGSTGNEAFTVNPGETATTFVSANPTNPNYGDQINFTFQTVESPYIGAAYNPLVGNITVWADATSSGTISAVTGSGSNPIIITSLNNGLTTGQTITIFGVTGDTAANGTFAVTRIDSDHFSIVATGTGAYTGGGTWVLGGTNLGTSSIDSVSGLASILSPALPNALSQGTHTITGFFNSTNPNFGESNATTTNFVVSPAASHVTSVTANPTSSTFGTAVTFTATVTTAIGTLPITGDVQSSVTFVDTTTGTTLGTGFLVAGGTASITTSLLNVNTSPGHTITATYTDTLPSSPYASSTGTLVGYRVAQAPTSVTVPSAAPASGTYVYGAPGGITFSATASSTAGALPVGAGSIISFYNGTAIPANLLGTGPIDAAGVATYTTTPFQVNAGIRTITAVYSDTLDNNFANSAPQSLSNYSVVKAPTSVAVSAAPASGDIFGQSVTFTATVSVTGSSTATVPDAVNNVTFVDTTTGITLGIGSTTGGVATITTSALTANIAAGHTITASYSDTAGNLANTPGTLTGYQVALASTSVSLVTSAPAPGGAALGQSVTFTATVSNITPGSTIPVNSTTAPGSRVTFKNATTGTVLGSAPVNASGVATFTLAFSAASATGYAITAQYNVSPTISPNFSASTIDVNSTVTQIVRKASATTAVSSAPAPTGAGFGQTVNFTVTVTGTGGIPQGAVTVSIDGGAPISAGSLNSSGHLTYSNSTLTVGTHTLVFFFGGDVVNNFAPSNSATLSQIVRTADTTTLTSNYPGGSNYGQAVTFTATVTANGAPNPGVGMGTVTFRDTTTGVILASNVALNAAGQAVFTTTAAHVLSVASHNITATYSGYAPTTGPTYAAGPVGTMTQVVSKAVTTVAMPTSSLPAGSNYGQAVNFRTVVTAASGGTPPTTGAIVKFYDGATFLGNGTLVSTTTTSATYSFTTTATQLIAATHSITATYTAPAGNFQSSGPSPALSQVVSQAVTQTVLSWTQTPASNYWAIGVPLRFSARVSATSAGTPGVPTGSVQFNIDGVITTVPLVNGVATMPAATTFGGAPPTNNHTVTVTYQPTVAPNQNFAASTSTRSQNVLLPTSLTLRSSAAGTSPLTGTAVTFTAVVATTSPGGPPTGTLNFIIDGVNYLGTLVSSNATSDTYTFTTTTLTAGIHSISAHYSGDANFNPADPTANLTQSITARVGRST